MSAHYIVRLVSEDGSIIREVQDTAGFIDDVLVPFGIKSKGISRHIDPYGTTTLNMLQVDELISEISCLQTTDLNSRHMFFLSALETMLRASSEQVHTYVKFIGD
jgi:hypothetical protein